MKLGAVARTQFSGALLRGDGGKRGPALLEVLAAAVRTVIFSFSSSDGQSLRKGFLAGTAEEFVVGHTDLHSAEMGDGRILGPLVGRFNMGQVTNSVWSRIFPEIGSRILRGSAGWN